MTADDTGPRPTPNGGPAEGSAQVRADGTTDSPSRVGDEIGRKAARKLRGRRERDRGLWFGLGMFGLIGWSVALPTVLGVALGVWIDARFPHRISWTLTLLFCGVVLGCINAWFWMRKEGDSD